MMTQLRDLQDFRCLLARFLSLGALVGAAVAVLTQASSISSSPVSYISESVVTQPLDDENFDSTKNTPKQEFSQMKYIYIFIYIRKRF